MAITLSKGVVLAATFGIFALTGSAFAQSEALPLGEPVTPEVGQTYVAEQFGDWEIRCVRQEEGVFEPCQMYQLLIDVNGNSVAELTAFALPDGQEAAAGATVITPLETNLATGVQFFVDDFEPLRYPFEFCNQLGCYARMGWSQGMVDDLKQGGVATVLISPFANPNAEVIITASLDGFTAAMGWMEDRLAAVGQ